MACENGHVNILEWFKNNKYVFSYDAIAINNACLKGHINVLEWFTNNKEYIYLYDDIVFEGNHMNIIEFFKNNMKY